MWSLGVLFSILYLRFFIRALVGDDIFGFLCYLVCFAMLIALCRIISVMFLVRISMSSCSSSAVNLFFHFELKRVLLRSNHLSVNSCSCILVYKRPPFRSGVERNGAHYHHI